MVNMSIIQVWGGSQAKLSSETETKRKTYLFSLRICFFYLYEIKENISYNKRNHKHINSHLCIRNTQKKIRNIVYILFSRDKITREEGKENSYVFLLVVNDSKKINFYIKCYVLHLHNLH